MYLRSLPAAPPPPPPCAPAPPSALASRPTALSRPHDQVPTGGGEKEARPPQTLHDLLARVTALMV